MRAGGVQSVAEARQRGEGRLQQLWWWYSRNSVKVLGTPEVYPGMEINLRGLQGTQHNGVYLVHRVQHWFDLEEGYTTTCTLLCNAMPETRRGPTELDLAQGEAVQTRVAEREQARAEALAEARRLAPEVGLGRWEREGGAITEALVGDEVDLSAYTRNIGDGEVVRFSVTVHATTYSAIYL